MEVVRNVIVRIGLVVALLGGCEKVAKRPAKVLDLRNVHDFKVCPLHDVLIREDREPIEFAHISWDYRYFEARNKTFPLANTGDITDRDATVALVLFCPECRKARERWMAQEREQERKRDESAE
jgi:hypothetical protein